MSLEEIASFQKELRNFGIEVIKFPKTGSPAARTVFVNLDPKRLYWVGKGGRSSEFDLESNLVINRGRFGTEGNPPFFPSEQFKKLGKPENTGCYLSLKNSNDVVDLEFSNPHDLEKFVLVIEHIIELPSERESKVEI